MTNITNWTQKVAGVDETRPEHYPVVLLEMNKAGHKIEKWLIGIYHDQETANHVWAKVTEIITIGEESPPLTENDVEDIKRKVANLN